MPSPKEHIEILHLKDKSYGIERRRNLAKAILEHGTPFPKSVGYKDIDTEFKRFVEEELDITYDDVKLPTLMLFSNQKIGEYSQTWQYLDDVGNILMNFKTITRDNNPQKGNIYGGMYNIPGDRKYPIHIVPVLQENGQHSYDIYSMRQPFGVDLTYTINIVTNKYELLNEFNELIHNKFKSLQCYIFPNEHPMSMILNSVTDESEYTIDDRKFYSQSFSITVRAYIIRKEDFEITHIPSRVILMTDGDRFSRKNRKRNNKKNIDYDIVEDPCKIEIIDERYYYKTVQINCSFEKCEKEITFTIDCDISLSTIEITNIYSFLIIVNDEIIDYNNLPELSFYNGDIIKIKIEKDELDKESSLSIIGYDKSVILDKFENNESSLDDSVDTEIINIV